MLRTQDWHDEFGYILADLPAETAALVVDGSIEICPCCQELSAYAWQDATGYDEFEDGIIPGGFQPEPGCIAHIGTASGWEFECGHCRAHVVDGSSPILSPCYTHEDFEIIDE